MTFDPDIIRRDYGILFGFRNRTLCFNAILVFLYEKAINQVDATVMRTKRKAEDRGSKWWILQYSQMGTAETMKAFP